MFDVYMSLEFIFSSERYIAFSFTSLIRTETMGPSEMIFQTWVIRVIDILVIVST